MAVPSQYFIVSGPRECSSVEEVPKINDHEFLYGTVKCSGNFDYLLWKSHLPPYYSYISTCEIQEQKSPAVKRKRSMKYGVALY
jgi:hypothetical protein